MTIRTVFPADGARVIERRGRRSKYHLFNNDFRNARAARNQGTDHGMQASQLESIIKCNTTY